MGTNQPAQSREIAAAELAQRCPQLRAAAIVDALSLGLAHLSELIVQRVHHDVQQEFGVDTMIGPSSLATGVKQVLRAGLEIDVYTSVVACDEIERDGYVGGSDSPEKRVEWLLDWLTRLRLDRYDAKEVERRLASYRGQSEDDRRRKFVQNLQRTEPESLRTPLVLYRVAPLAVRIIAATAFGDLPRAEQLRSEQREILPAIGFCNDCQGRLLPSNADCPRCGNPVWTFDWLRES